MLKHESSNKLPRSIAIKLTLKIFSDPWSFAVLEELFFGICRFDDFQRNLSISRSVLARRLRHLEEQKIIDRKLYSTKPDRYEYKLTERGKDMYPIFITLQQWGESWLEAEPSKLKLVHTKCDLELRPALKCVECMEDIKAQDIRYEYEGP